MEAGLRVFLQMLIVILIMTTRAIVTDFSSKWALGLKFGALGAFEVTDQIKSKIDESLEKTSKSSEV